MTRTTQTTLRTKLLLLALLTSGLAIFLLTAANVTVQLKSYQDRLNRNLETYADLVAFNSTAALMFKDPDAGSATLRSLDTIPAIAEGVLYTNDGMLLVAHTPKGRSSQAPDKPGKPGMTRDGTYLHTYRAVHHEGDLVGTLYLRYDTTGEVAQLTRDVILSAAIGGVALLVALLLALRLQRNLSRPIVELGRTVAEVAETRDYKARAVKYDDDELGALTDGVNEMLHQIQMRDWALEEHRAYLEKRVEERTEELSRTNTDLQETNRELTKAIDETVRLAKIADSANRAKSAFLANMSHEIRTPATAIMGYIDLMQRQNRSAEQIEEWFSRIKHNADHLVTLVNDLLDLSKIEAGQLGVNISPTGLIELFRQVESTMRPLADQKTIDFSIRLMAPLPREITTDALRLRQILINLINNAIKFTDAGGRVAVEAALRSAESGDRQNLFVTVEDNGIGIPNDKIDKIFQPFMQAYDSTKTYGGVGLGLNISRRLAHMLNGDIEVQSEEGVGTLFTVHVDVGATSDLKLIDPEKDRSKHEVHAPDPGNTQNRLRHVRILVADDNPDNQRIIRFLLEETKADIQIVGDGRQAIEAYRASVHAGMPFDIILMDMQMPELNGFEATSKLRREGVAIPIIAMTAYALDEDRERCMAAGCDAHVAKPINPDVFFDTLFRLAGLSSKSAATRRNASCAIDKPVKSIISSMATNPAFAGILAEYIADIPNMISNIEEHRRTGNHIELMTDVHQLRGTGASFGFPEISEAAGLCEDLLRQDATQSAILASIDQLLSVLRSVAPVKSHGKNVDRLLSTMSSQPAFAPLLDEYLGAMPGTIGRIDAALSEQDMEILHHEVHCLKGTGGSYGFPAISEAATQCQELIRSKADPSTIHIATIALLDLLRSTLPASARS